MKVFFSCHFSAEELKYLNVLFNLVICAWSRHFMSSCFKGFVLAPFYKETWVVGFPELWELTSAWFCSNSAMLRRNQPNFLISYLNLWVVLPGSLLEKPVLLILHTTYKQKSIFMGISTYISYLHMPALAEFESVLFIFAWTSVRNLHSLVNGLIAAAQAAGLSAELIQACSLKQWVQTQL